MNGHEPPTLAAVLDAGTDLTGWPRLGILAEEVLTELPTYPASQRAREAFVSRTCRAQALESGDQAFAAYCQWLAELAEDETGDLTERFRQAIPAQLRDECAKKAAQARSPHPLTTGDPCEQGAPWWRCNACGRGFDGGHRAVTVEHQEGFSDLPYRIYYCADCVRKTVEGLDGR